MSRQYCSVCQRPLSVCYCSALVQVANKIKVLIIQHPLEVTHPFNTGRMAHLCLANSELIIAESLSPEELNNLLATPSVLLYPSLAWLSEPDCSLDLQKSNSNVQQLIVIDATWRKSKKILHLHPQLQQLPRLSLEGDLTSNYQIRKSSLPNSLSTVESVVNAMRLLDPGTDFELMLKPFKRMIELQRS
jgi:DTW domain-containing protein YfiP